MKKKIHEFHGFGFPVILQDVPVKEVFGEEIIDIDFNKLQKCLAVAVALKPSRLTGNEVKFLRLHQGKTLQVVGDSLGVSKQAVIKWEKRGDAPIDAQWAAEKEFRMQALAVAGVDSGQFLEAFNALKAKAQSRQKPVELKASAVSKSVKRLFESVFAASYGNHAESLPV